MFPFGNVIHFSPVKSSTKGTYGDSLDVEGGADMGGGGATIGVGFATGAGMFIS